METRTWHCIKFGMGLGIALIAIATAIAANAYHTGVIALGNAATVAPTNVPDILGGIGFSGLCADEDVAYLRDNLRFLREHVPQWYAYVAENERLVFSVDLSLGERGLAANSKCCDERGYGSITFGAHFGDVSNDLEDQTASARQITFLSTLIHEITHIRDWRAGRVSTKVNFVTCVNSERAAFSNEVEFKRALASAAPGIPGLSKPFRDSLERQIHADARMLEGAAIHLYCLPVAPGGSE